MDGGKDDGWIIQEMDDEGWILRMGDGEDKGQRQECMENGKRRIKVGVQKMENLGWRMKDQEDKELQMERLKNGVEEDG